MKLKFLFLIVFMCLFISCERKIILRVDPVVKIPFKKEIEKGDYVLNFYKLKYPDELVEKEKFYSDLNISVKKIFIKDQKRTVIVNEKFYSDYLSISEGEFLPEEKIIEKVASNLTLEDIEKLNKLTGFRIEKFKNTVQENLNRQVYHLMKILNKEDEFEENRIYTEREKNNFVLEIKKQRKEIAKLIKQMKLDLVIDIENPYVKDFKDRYWDDVDIKISTSSDLRADIASYSLPVFIENLREKDIDNVLTGSKSFINKIVLLKNNKYNGYIYNENKKSFVFLLGGIKLKNQFPGYNIKIKVKTVEFKELISLNEKYILSDFSGGK